MFTNRQTKRMSNVHLGELSGTKRRTNTIRDYGNRHPYTRPEFWAGNKFWLRGGYSQKAIEYYEAWFATL